MSQPTAIARPAVSSPIASWAEDPQGGLQLTGAEPPLTREEQDVQERVHRFAAEVMRPIGQQLDRMTPEEVIAENSPLWSVFQALPNRSGRRLDAGVGAGADSENALPGV